MKVLDEWKNLTLSQFYDKRILGGIMRAVSEVFQDAYDESQELRELLNIDKQEGVNLDYIGEIVCLSRADAHKILRRGTEFELTDDLFRKVLKYKIILNNSNASYYDIMEGIGLIWNMGDVVYREDPNKPATYILDLKTLDVDDSDSLHNRTMTIKAGGVKVLFIVTLLLHNYYKFWKTTSRVTYKINIPFFNRQVRTFDGTWKLDGTYKLDASVNRKLMASYKLPPVKHTMRSSMNHLFDIPDRLIVTSCDSRTYVAASKEAAIVGDNNFELTVDVVEDGMKITSDEDPEVSNDGDYTSVIGAHQHSGTPADYLVSDKELYALMDGDDLVITFAADVQFDLEMSPTIL